MRGRSYGIVIAMYFDDHGFPHFHARHAGASATNCLRTGRRARTGETLLEIEPLRCRL